MIKLSKKLYERLIFAASEAKDLELNNLADGVLLALPPEPQQNDNFFVSESEVKKEIYNSLWKNALNIMALYDVSSADIQKIGEELEILSRHIFDNLESTLDVQNKVPVKEPKVPGQK